MISDALQKWKVVIVIFLGAVHSQIPMMPMPFGYGQMMVPGPPPPPIAVAVPVGIPIPYPETTTTTTTTTTTVSSGAGEGNRGVGIPIAIPVPVPHFVQIAIPGFQPPNCAPKGNTQNGNKNCPPCPPCSCNPCTPSFFAYCSPCHLQCRCKNGQENPKPQDPKPPQPLPGPAFPMPIPMPAPPPVVIVPFPPQFSKRQDSSECTHTVSTSASSEDSDSCTDDESRYRSKRKRGKKRRKPKYDIYRRNFADVQNKDRLVKPVLTYLSRDGEIKVKRRLSNDEAAALLDDDSYQNVQLIAGEDSNNMPRVVVRSQSQPGMRSNHRRRQLMLHDGSQQHSLGDGKKELVFRPPENKKISNLSVSFQITK
ncbi:hypothetical protein HF086_013891 [Spodoptera exigua]|uniref:Uncharacterized protein n=1 Tax=Spodoptera exigua TaxID=7107 RepID=A0A922MH31_SPOEX|nr:hypothetical protein HF086_013891 [Spodoptera exigua]